MMSRTLFTCLALLLAGCLTTPELEPGECPTDAQMEDYCARNRLCGASFNTLDGCTYRCSTPCVSASVALVRTMNRDEILNKFEERVMSNVISMAVGDELFFGVVGVSPAGGPVSCGTSRIIVDNKNVQLNSSTNSLSITNIQATNPGEYTLKAYCDQQEGLYTLRVTLPQRTLTGESLPQPEYWMRADTPFSNLLETSTIGEDTFVTFWGSEVDVDQPVGWDIPQDTMSTVTLEPAARLLNDLPALTFSGEGGLRWFQPPDYMVGTVMMAMRLDMQPGRQFVLGGDSLEKTRISQRSTNTMEVCWSAPADTCLDQGTAFQGMNLSSAQIHTISFAQTNLSYHVSGSSVPVCTSIGREGRGPLALERLGFLDADNNMSGQIAEILVFDRELSKAQRLPYERYLGTKYGVRLQDMSTPCF